MCAYCNGIFMAKNGIFGGLFKRKEQKESEDAVVKIPVHTESETKSTSANHIQPKDETISTRYIQPKERNLEPVPQTADEMFLKGSEHFQKEEYEAALEWYQKAARLGSQESMIQLGRMYSQGIGTPKNPYKSFDNYYGAKYYNDDITLIVALCYLTGNGTLQSTFEGRQLIEPLAKAGNVNAQVLMGHILEGRFNSPAVMSEAAKWYKKAADKGSAEALYYLGFMYLEGRGVRKAADKGMDCIWKSANLDYIPAINTYGLMIISGVNANEDDEPNYKEAAEWIKLAANGDDPKNQYAMAWLYENGYGVEQSFEDALEYYELAMNSDIEERKEAEEGYYRMAKKLGRMY